MLDTTALDRDVEVLRSSAKQWVTTSLAEKRKLLEALRAATAEVAGEWVRASCQGKGIALDSPAAGEEWMSGPYALISNVAALIRLLERLEAGSNPLDRVRVRTLPSGQVALRAFPAVAQDRVLAGYTGDVWLRPGVTLEQAKVGVARRLRDRNLPGEVGLVLGAGNINSIPPLDGLTKLYQDNAVVLIKLSPVNAYLEPVLNRAFAAFVERGFARITAGGTDVGSYLVHHPGVDAIHITGNSASHDAVVFGPGEEGARRKQAREPLVTKPITSELGGVGPVVVVPGRWRDSTLRFQAQNVATQRLHNSGFNCIATQIVILPQRWPQAGRFLDYLRQAMRDAPDRPAYYPGAADRQRWAVEAHPKAELLGGDADVPRTLLTDLHPDDVGEPAFRTEYFGPVLGVTRLPGASAEEFLDDAVEFCNDRLAGDLGVGLIAAPQTIRELGPRFDTAVARLRYGTVAINCWVGPVFAMPRGTWGAFPGHDIYELGSGVGIVHNALLLDPEHVERSVGRGPFHPWPKPLWFVTNRTAHATGEQMTRFAAGTSLARTMPRVLAALASSLRG
ncbi:MAG TPA: aldehyde dehydrogenase family protein [Actinomycetes bacterium]|nr:aldehyde dehydrogenase family protein [Actinomycetes bacterium]